MTMQQIAIPKTFFIKEREHLYSHWRTAFWREMFQNSLDAGARRIDVNFNTLENGDLVVLFNDNGHGMSEETINDVFFALGQTTKQNEDGVGGFGRARILTCFAMENYEFWSKHSHCKGDGAMYQVETVPEDTEGCRFRINVGKQSLAEMEECLTAVLQRSQLDCRVYIKDVQFTNWMRKNRHVKNESFGGIYVNKSRRSGGHVVVRVKGLWTFSIRTPVECQVVVEIDPSKSREVLTINRDSMHYQYQDALQSFLELLTVDKRSALRENRRKTRLILGTGVHTSHPLDHLDKIAAEKSIVLKMVNAPTAPIGGCGVAAAVAAQSLSHVEREVIPGEQFQTGLPTIYLNDQTDALEESHKRVRRVIDQYDPMNWRIFEKKRSVNDSGTETFRKGGAKLKLLITWEACCSEAIRALLQVRQMEIKWLVGWTFDFEAAACHEGLCEGHALCLNPVDTDGTMKYKYRNKGDQKRLMALAKHEVAHIIHKYHDEDFSSIHTDIDSEFDEGACRRLISSSLKHA
jgi:hypothetical protein